MRLFAEMIGWAVIFLLLFGFVLKYFYYKE